MADGASAPARGLCSDEGFEEVVEAGEMVVMVRGFDVTHVD